MKENFKRFSTLHNILIYWQLRMLFKTEQQSNLCCSGDKIRESVFKYDIICFLGWFHNKFLGNKETAYDYRTLFFSISINFIQLSTLWYLMMLRIRQCSQEICAGLRYDVGHEGGPREEIWKAGNRSCVSSSAWDTRTTRTVTQQLCSHSLCLLSLSTS